MAAFIFGLCCGITVGFVGAMFMKGAAKLNAQYDADSDAMAQPHGSV